MTSPETLAPSPEAVAAALAASRYLADESLATAVFLAIRLGKPLLLEGAPGVGKTQLCAKYAHNEFHSECPTTIGVEFLTVTHDTGVKPLYKIQVWDTASQERFRAISRSVYNGAVAGIAVFDVTSPATFDDLVNQWIPELQATVPNAKVAILGTKLDLVGDADATKPDESRVPVAVVREYAAANGFNYLGDFALPGVPQPEVVAAFASALGLDVALGPK